MTKRHFINIIFCLTLISHGAATAAPKTATGFVTKITFYSEDVPLDQAKNFTLFKLSTPIQSCDWLHILSSQYTEEGNLFRAKQNLQQIKVFLAGNSALKHQYEDRRVCKIRRIEYL